MKKGFYRHVAPTLLFLPLFFFALSNFCRAAQPQSLSDAALAKIAFEQRLDQQLSLDLEFRDEQGQPVKLGQFFTKKPVILVLGYYECPMLCTLQLNGLTEALQDMKWSIGQQFDVLCVSISPTETASLAAAKKQTCLRRYGRSGAAGGWHFLTGNEEPVHELASEVGFHYAYDPVFKQYAHPSGFVVLTPEGKVARYFFGVTHSPKEIYSAMMEAASNKIGSPIQQLFFLCFHYNPIKGKYGAFIMLITRICAAATLAGIVWLIVSMVRLEKRPASHESHAL